MNKELLRDAASVMETWWAKFPQDMSASDRAVVTRMQAEIDAPEPYDQQALELCTVCGWKALIPGDCCLNCTRVLDAPNNCTRSHPHENMSQMCALRTEIARLKFEAGQQVAAPPGWVSVPVKPTNAMVNVMLDWGTKKSEWEAILAAAPQPPQAVPQVPTKAITASIMREDGGDRPAFCVMVAYRSQADAQAALAMLSAAPKPPKAGLVPMTEPELDDLLPTNTSMARTDALRWVARATERKHGIEVKP